MDLLVGLVKLQIPENSAFGSGPSFPMILLFKTAKSTAFNIKKTEKRWVLFGTD